MEALAAGRTIEATVTRLEHYGAWIESGGRTGLILIPEISWSRIRHPSEALAVGQSVSVRILHVSEAQFWASLKAMHPELNPWRDPAVFAVGQDFTGPVIRVLEFGCYVELRPDVWGLLRRDQWRQPIEVGQRLNVRVVSVDAELRKIEVRLIA